MQILDPMFLHLSNGNTVIFTIENWLPEEPERYRTICKKTLRLHPWVEEIRDRLIIKVLICRISLKND